MFLSEPAHAAAGVQTVASIRAFLGSILPVNGVYFVADFDTGGRVTHHACNSLDDLARRAADLDQQGRSVYHACAAYKAPVVMEGQKRTFRKRDNVRSIRSFWLDLDVAPDDSSKYPDQSIALAAVVEFAQACNLPVPSIVNSGGGLHVYWPLLEEVGLAEWKPVADNLKRLAAECGLRADPTRTADPSSILRPVGTYNRKRPAVVKVDAVSSAEPITLAAFAAAINARLTASPAHLSSSSVGARIDNSQFAVPNSSRPAGPFTPAERTRIDEALSFIPADDYDTWFRVGAALKSSGDPAAFEIWDAWSRTAEDKYQPEGMATKWGTISADGGVSLGTLFLLAKEHGYIPTSGEERCTDTGNAQRLVRLFGKGLRFVPTFGKWLFWDGARWAFDEDGQIYRFAKQTAKSLYEEAVREPNDDRRRALAKHAANSENASRIEAMIRLAWSEPGVSLQPAALDADDWSLNVHNGTLDLKTGALRRARESDFNTKRASVAFDPNAVCPSWERFVLEVMGGDVELVSYLQRALGYSLTGNTSEQCVFFLHGFGANGKSTLLNTVRTLLGDYAMNCPAETLMVKREGGISNDIARLRGARFVAASETEDGHRLAESLLKQLTGGDAVTARFLHQEFFDFIPRFKIFLAANHKPIISGGDHGIWRRIHLIPFEVTFPEGARDVHLGDKLSLESPGILNWMLDGLAAYQREGLKLPMAARSATDQYRTEMDVIGQWIDERCTREPSAATQASTLFVDFDLWARLNGRRQTTSMRFYQKLTEQGFRKVKSSAMYYQGLALKPSAGSVA
jgi:putative DNA primase/helicase